MTAKIQETPQLLQAGSGALFFFLIWIFFLARRDNFWNVMEHELTHAIFALLFLKKVHKLNAHRSSGGLVQVEGGNFVIALAPYFFPLVAVVIILIKPIILPEIQWLLNILLGAAIMFHFIYLLGEFSPAQPDIRYSGFLFSILFILFFNIFFLGLSLASLSAAWSDILTFIKHGLNESMIFSKEVWIYFNDLFTNRGKI
ncbi:MAG: M50 family metallopeptidase [Calditrichia bacterium]